MLHEVRMTRDPMDFDTTRYVLVGRISFHHNPSLVQHRTSWHRWAYHRSDGFRSSFRQAERSDASPDDTDVLGQPQNDQEYSSIRHLNNSCRLDITLGS